MKHFMQLEFQYILCTQLIFCKFLHRGSIKILWLKLINNILRYHSTTWNILQNFKQIWSCRVPLIIMNRVNCANLFRFAKIDGFWIHEPPDRPMLIIFSYYWGDMGIVSGAYVFFWPKNIFGWNFFRYLANLSRTRRGFSS